MNLIYDLLIIVVFLILIFVIFVRLRTKLLFLWKEVSVKEVVFHRTMTETIGLFYAQKESLKNDDNRIHFVRLGRSRKKKARYLLLKERQDLYLYLSDLYNEIDELENNDFDELKKSFVLLQKARRIYNSKVLVYNQTISVFPTRFLAIKMNLKIKEYFG